jgi:uncharacterized protein DUF3107
MEVKIGVLHTPKELSLDVDLSAEEVANALDEAIKKEDAVLWLDDAKGRRVGIPAARVAYVEIETNGTSKRVGFGS